MKNNISSHEEGVEDYLRIEGEDALREPDLWRSDDYGFPVQRFLYPYRETYSSNSLFAYDIFLTGGPQLWL